MMRPKLGSLLNSGSPNVLATPWPGLVRTRSLRPASAMIGRMPQLGLDFFGSPKARPLLRMLSLALPFGAVASAVIVVITTAGGTVSVPLLVAVLAVPLVAIGQITTIAIVIRRSAEEPRALGQRTLRSSLVSLRWRLFGDLSAPIIGVVAVIFYGAVAIAAVSMSSVASGQPVRNEGGCRYGANNHWVVTCLSRAEYDVASAAWERGFAGVLAGFFTVQAAVIGSEIRRQRTVEELVAR